MPVAKPAEICPKESRARGPAFFSAWQPLSDCAALGLFLGSALAFLLVRLGCRLALLYFTSLGGYGRFLARRLGTGFGTRLWSIHQFDQCHRRVIAQAKSELEDPQIAAGPLRVSRAQFVEELVNN